MLISEIRIGTRHRGDLGDLMGLMGSISEVGLLHPVAVRPDGILVAGLRRLEACKRLGWDDVPVHVVHTVEDAVSLLKAERDENVCRKDFLPSEAVAMAEAIEPLEREMGNRNRELAGRPKKGENFTPISGGNKSLDRVAAAVGMSRPTLLKAREVVASGNQELIRQMDETGKVDRAYQELRCEQNRERMCVQSFPTGKYRVIYADPPWQYGDPLMVEGYKVSAEMHYPTMGLPELKLLPVAEMAEDDAVLFLWATSPMVREAFELAEAWGFEYKAMFVWDKVKHNWGHYNSVRHELLLLCTRGTCLPDTKELVDSVQTVERGEHSEKPEEFRAIIDRLYPYGGRVELFARWKAENWDVWGNEAEIG